MSDANAQRLLAEAVKRHLPKGFAVTRLGDGQGPFAVLDELGRRRTPAVPAEHAEELAGEIKKLATEVAKIASWRRRGVKSESELAALAKALCPELGRGQGTRWGRAKDDGCPCCGQKVPAGWWWVHEASLAPCCAKGSRFGRDLAFADAGDLADYFLTLKETRFN